ncbi:MAG: glycosyltransferase N-terminal domain-containing protein [Bacteroidota bacterium]
MRPLYNFLNHVTYAHLQLAQEFSKKLKLFVQGRKDSFSLLQKAVSSDDRTIWFHCASLGEYEQGVPIIEEVRKMFPNHKIVLTFFSPSGFEVKKDSAIADVVVYLPFDTQGNARRFLELVHPALAIFVKYEFWPNYLFELNTRNIPTLLISGLFRKKQIFFKPYGGFMRKALRTFDHFFVQDQMSKSLLEELKLENCTISGDTRFDRVSHQIEMDNSLDFMEAFKGNALCIVCGSTWPEDEALLLEHINSSEVHIKYVIAPHKIDSDKIESFRSKLTKTSILFSEKGSEDLPEAGVLIVDTIGYLTRIYSYADIAYVGGAAGTTGLHNILEPATFGVPIIIGENFNDFPEAKRLQQLAGLFSVGTPEEYTALTQKLCSDKNFRSKTGMISGHFVNSNTGATRIVMDYLQESYRDRLIQIPSKR